MNCHLPGKRSKKPADCFFAFIILVGIWLFNKISHMICRTFVVMNVVFHIEGILWKYIII